MNSIEVIIKSALTLALILVVTPVLFAAPPPPPGVPIDAGLSVLVVAAVGYGAHKFKKEEI
jgi:hypothetical protein